MLLDWRLESHTVSLLNTVRRLQTNSMHNSKVKMLLKLDLNDSPGYDNTAEAFTEKCA